MEKDRFQEMLDELDLDKEFEEDFEVKEAKYDVYLYNYDYDVDHLSILDETKLVASFSDPEQALSKAEELTTDVDVLKKLAASNAHFVSVEVETTVETEGSLENVGTLFAEVIKIK